MALNSCVLVLVVEQLVKLVVRIHDESVAEIAIVVTVDYMNFVATIVEMDLKHQN